MSNQEASRKFRESLKVKDYKYPHIKQNSQKQVSAKTPGERGGQGRGKGGQTR